LFLELGYSSINQYAAVELGFSTSRTGDFIMLCRRLKKLPKVKAKVESGELGYTAARVLAPIADESNEEGWVNFALNHSRRDLEREVKRAKRESADAKAGRLTLIAVPESRPAAVVPVNVTMEMSPTQFARYEKLWEQMRKQGKAPADKVEAMLEMMAAYVSGPETSPRGEVVGAGRPPAQIHIHQCPDCSKSTVVTRKGELEIGEAELERAHCDCQVRRPGKRNTRSIPPAVRRKVLAKYRHKCQRHGCGHTQYLEVHHLVPRSRGGSNDPENLTCLCSACHKLLHENKTGFMVKSPKVPYEWNSGVSGR
ncbi:MAG: HNH endonuclease, partial [Candidatus Krumholzibacteriota bacterium]